MPGSMMSGVGITGLPLAERSQCSGSERRHSPEPERHQRPGEAAQMVQPRQRGASVRCKTAVSNISDLSRSVSDVSRSVNWAAKHEDDIQSAISGEEAKAKLHSDYLAIEKMVAAWEAQESAAEPKDTGTPLQTTFTFDYKKRGFEGQALHLLALYKGEAQINLLGRLLSMRADIEAECAFSDNVCLKKVSIQAIHLAAGAGNVPALQTLLNHNADVNVRSTRKVREGGDMVPKPHYTALSDAVFYHEVDAVRMLLEHGANANIPNCFDQTPLHLAVEQGFVDIAKALLKGGALLDGGPSTARKSVTTWQLHHNDGATTQTPLRLACECGRFPHHSLFLLTHRSLDDLIEVAGHSPEAALDMIHDQDENVVHPVWRAALVKREMSMPSSRSGLTANFTESLSSWCELMKLSPRAAVALLDSVTTAPKVTNANRHSLYRRAVFPKGEDMRCYYSQDATWDCDSESKWPEWHDRLAPQSIEYDLVERQLWGRPEQVIVKIKRLELRGVMNYRLMHTLAGTTDLTVFSSLPVQAIVKFAWDQVASRIYYRNVAMKVVEMCALISWVIFPPGDARRPFVWSILVTAAGRDVYHEICEMNGYIFLLKKPQEYFGDLANAWDWFCIVPLLTTIIQSGPPDYDEESVTVAVAAFTRWLQLCYFFRAVSCTGRKLLPIVHSFAALGGISLITIFVFMGFLHSFLALGDFNMGGDESIWSYVLNTCRLLFMGDGDGIDFVLQLEGDGPDGNLPTRVAFFISVFLFCVCILNLFIAVHSEAYDAAQQEADVRFIQTRADICFSCFLRPHWPPKKIPTWLRGYLTRRFDNQGRAYWVIFGTGACLWCVLMAAFGSLHSAVPSAVLLGAIILADMVDLQRPWDCERGVEHSLWICHRADFDPGAVVQGDSDQNQKLDALQSHSARHFRRVDETIARLEEKLDEASVRSDSEAARQFEGLGQEVRDLGGRMSQLEGAVGALAPAVRDLVEELQRRRVDEAQSTLSQASVANGLTSSATSQQHHRLWLASSPGSGPFN